MRRGAKRSAGFVLALLLCLGLVPVVLQSCGGPRVFPQPSRLVVSSDRGLGSAGAESTGGPLRVTDLAARQEGRDVVLTYNLAGGKSGERDEVIFEISVDEGRTWLTPKGIWGDAGKQVVAGRRKKIIWRALEEFPSGVDKGVRFRVVAKSEITPLAGKKGDAVTFTVSGVSFKMVRIPAGDFMMGSGLSPEEVDRRYGGGAKWYKEEHPQHRVRITKPFWMGETEVTQGLWKAVMVENPSYFKDCGDDCPVEEVSWNDAQEFIRRLNNAVTGVRFRLPTEAEWEYACRAGTTGAYAGDLDAMAWYANNSGNQKINAQVLWEADRGSYVKKILDNGCRIHAVGNKKPNTWGLYDMHGNVWEWCQDWYGDYPSGYVTDPAGPSSGSYRVLRGGGWSSGAGFCRSAYRGRSGPAGRISYGGFRLALSPGQ